MKKITIISIILILLLNIFIPTIVLAKEDVEKKNITSKEVEENVTNNNTSTVNTTTEDDENTNVSTNTTTNSTTNNTTNTTVETDKEENDNKNEVKVDIEQNIEKLEIDEKEVEKKSTMYIDAPVSGSTFYSSETESIYVKGWKMANISNTSIKAYLDGKEVETTVNYMERADVIEKVTGYGTAEQNPKPGFELNIDAKNLSEGNHKIKIDVLSGEEVLTSDSTTFNYSKEMHIEYQAHVADIGWQEYVKDGETAGTTNRNLRVEALKIELLNKPEENIKIKYEAHVQDIGWQGEREEGETAGTEGQALHIEALKIELEGTEEYSIMYRAHVQNIGWQDWVEDGEIAGTTGQNLGIEAIEIKIVEKQKKAKMYIDAPVSGSTFYSSETESIYVKGWKMANVSNTSIKAYLDGKEVETTVNSMERPDVIEAITGYGTAEQNPKPGFEFNIDANNLSEGNHEIKIDVLSGEEVLTSDSTTFNYSKEMHIQYQAHVRDIGWQEYVKDGATAGTTNRNLRIEALKIELLNKPDENIKIKYEAHVQDIGWQGEREDGETAGTEGQALHIEALKIELEGTEEYSIMYRAHVQEIGWQDWVEDGEIAGTTGQNLGIEAIEIKIVEKQKKSTMYIDAPVSGSTFYSSETESIYVKGWKMANVSNTTIKAYLDGKEVETTVNYMERPDVIEAIAGYGTAEQNPKPGFEFNIDAKNLTGGNHTIEIKVYYKDEVIQTDSTTFNLDTNLHIRYSAHVADRGWQEEVKDGETAGTTGRNLEVQALKIELINKPETAHIKYRVYVEGSGWTEYVKDGEQAGTTGQNKKIQAIQIEIEGLEGYVVEYQAHVQEIGWQSWASNGMEVGTTIQVFGIEAINIRVVEEKNTVVPKVTYSAHNSSTGWSSYVENGITVGDTTSGVKLDAIKIALGNTENANIKYRVHLQDLGWQDYSYNNGQAGTGKQENGIEAIQMELEGLSGYSIQYRSYVIGQGWQDWVKDGKISGTTGEALQIGAIQIKITIKVDIVTNSNFSQLDESKYPGYKEALQDLQEQHPNWTIVIDYTNLDWNAVLEGEHSLTDKGGARSLTQATGAWRDSTDTKEYEPGWFRASKEAIAYMMDPRNSFDDEYIFQFQELASSEGTYSDIANMIQGTYLTRYEGKLPGTTTASIINTILSSAQQYNISPYHLTSRMIHEQGTNGTPLSEGYVYNGRTVYNLFNIQATGSTNEEIWQNGAAYAYNNHWWSPELCINGSANFLNTSYISRGQSTLYYQKYNVVSYKYYEHQYMTNIRGANDEGQRIGAEYKANGLIDSHFVFTIPVYENMPATKAPRPST